VADSEITSITTSSSTPWSTTSTLQSSALTVTVTHTGCQQGEECSGATVVPVIGKAHMKIILRDAKDHMVAQTLNMCGFHNSSGCLTVVKTALKDACLSVIKEGE
jgi:hypothetical protein